MSEDEEEKPKKKEEKPEKSDLSLYVVDRDEFCKVTEDGTEECGERKALGKIKPKSLSQTMLEVLRHALLKTNRERLEFAYELSDCMEIFFGVDCSDFYDEIARINDLKELYQMRHELLYKPVFDKIANHASEWHETGRTTPFRVNYSKVVKEKGKIKAGIRELNKRARRRVYKTLNESFGVTEAEFNKWLLEGKV